MAKIQVNNPDLYVVENVDYQGQIGNASILYQLQQIAQGGGGGGGGSATAENQLEQIALETAISDNTSSINDEISAFRSENNENLQNYLGKLINAGSVGGNTVLYDLLVKLNTIAVNTTSEANSLTDLTKNVSVSGKVILNDLYARMLDIYNANISIRDSTRAQVGYLNFSGINNTNSIYTVGFNYNDWGVRFKYMTIQIQENAGATGTLNIEVKQRYSNYMVVPLIDKQATTIGAYVYPPYNVAGGTGMKMYTLDLTGLWECRITPSVLSTSYNYTIYLHN
jgi:hypothetical protein